MTIKRFSRRTLYLALSFACFTVIAIPVRAQTAATGAITGTVRDTSGGVIVGAKVTATLSSTGETRQVVTNSQGFYRFPLLPPGKYRLKVERSGFKAAVHTGVSVTVTETSVVNLKLEVGSVAQTVEVKAQPNMVQTASSALGRVVNERAVVNLPLATRNYTQILALSPGIIAPVNNATDLGRGSGGLSGSNGNGTELDSGIHVHGALANDNNFQMNGVQINDLFGRGAASGGIAIPSPDAIQEFKVQTGQYDAEYGRNAGANVDVVTKSGTNDFHGDLFEFFRDRSLNANDFFSNLTGQPKGDLHQNQFGATLGGPIKKDKVFFFGSYQGTRQKNGIATSGGNNCRTTAVLPPLTNDRSAHAIATIFAGQRGALQNAFGGVGPAIDPNAPNGNGTPYPYNINPVSLALLQLKLPNGSYYIPNPQTSSGLTTFTNACTFNDNQYMANVDYLPNIRSRLSVKYFISDSTQTVTFPNDAIMPDAGLPGSPSDQPERFQVLSVSHTYTFSPTLLNELRFGFHRTAFQSDQHNPFSFSSIGASASPFFNDLPSIFIGGCCQLGGAADLKPIQQSWGFSDALSWSHGKQNIRIGGGYSRNYLNLRNFRFNGIVDYLTWPDFLLGLDGAQNGTGVFSNIIVTVAVGGLTDRNWRTNSIFGYVEDNFTATRRLTLNAGLRYEHIGELGDQLGRNANFDPALANPDPPTSGTLAGFVVPSNYPGTIPPGVTQTGNDLGIAGDGQDTFGPRLGLAWQILPNSSRFVLRTGYGIYYSQPVAQAVFQLTSQQPFGFLGVCPATCNAAASAQSPFGAIAIPAASSLPSFQPYSPSTNQTVYDLAQNYRPPITQQYSLGVQTELARNFMLEVGYFGTRATKVIRTRGLNQALSASPSNPVRGQTSNTFDNIAQRLPYIGFSSGAGSIAQLESAGAAWYNGLETSLTKRFSNGLQFLASYTWSRDLSTDGADPEASTAAGSSYGSQSANPNARYGPALFNRDQRLVVSYVYDFPSPRQQSGWKPWVLGNWSVAGVTTIQSGQHLTLVGDNAFNVFGITTDRVEMMPGCTYSQLVTPGSVERKLTNYFNSACISPKWPIIGANGVGTAFGNSGVGIVTGPGQDNWDISVQKMFAIHENKRFLVRADFFNAFNHPQFSNPDVNTSDSTFGYITSTSVNPRVVQLAAKFVF